MDALSAALEAAREREKAEADAEKQRRHRQSRAGPAGGEDEDQEGHGAEIVDRAEEARPRPDGERLGTAAS